MAVSCNRYLIKSKLNLADMYFGSDSRCFIFTSKTFDLKYNVSENIQVD
jgi:hypothetical protein